MSADYRFVGFLAGFLDARVWMGSTGTVEVETERVVHGRVYFSGTLGQIRKSG